MHRFSAASSQTAPQPTVATGYSKGGTIASSSTHLWARCHLDPRIWVIFPADPLAPVTRAVPDDFGTLVPVGLQ